MSSSDAIEFRWLRTGDDTFPALLSAIEAAKTSIEFESYIYTFSPIGERFRDALVGAARRGARVRVLIDSFGSITLSDSFWGPLRQAGGAMRWFNPLTLRRFNIRNHRKLLICDHKVGFIGGGYITPGGGRGGRFGGRRGPGRHSDRCVAGGTSLPYLYRRHLAGFSNTRVIQ